MNCKEFEQLVSELGADRMVLPRIRIAALAHAASCESCGARLAAEKKLNLGLLALAEITCHDEAPLGLKQSLRAEFEARKAQFTAKSAAPSEANFAEQQSIWSKIKRLWDWEFFARNSRWQLAAAMATIIVFVVAVSVWWNQGAPEQPFLIGSPSPKITHTPDQTSGNVNDLIPKFATSDASLENIKIKSKIHPRRQKLIRADKTDLAANYIPLSYAMGSTMPDESVVVRVDVPRATLIALGLPLSMNLNAERDREMVKADLRVGFDGVPLAIRLVRQ